MDPDIDIDVSDELPETILYPGGDTTDVLSTFDLTCQRHELLRL